MVQQMLCWAEIAQKVLLPICAISITGFCGWTAAEITSLRQHIADVQVQVAELKVELKLHRENPPDVYVE